MVVGIDNRHKQLKLILEKNSVHMMFSILTLNLYHFLARLLEPMTPLVPLGLLSPCRTVPAVARSCP